jgi:TonB family protein
MTTQLEKLIRRMLLVATLCVTLPSLAQQPPAAKPALPPLTLSVSNNVYPTAARRAGVQGRVLVRFTIKKNGVPDNVVVDSAEPEVQFDEVAVNLVKRVRFTVPQDWAQTGAVTQPYQLSVLFKLHPCPKESCIVPIRHDGADDFLIVAAERPVN